MRAAASSLRHCHRVPRWLPFHFDGPRQLDEVRVDLLSISEAGTRSKAHVTVYRRVGGLLCHRTGALEVIPDERKPGTLRCGVAGGGDMFTLSPDSFEEAHLHTIDGADYYALRLLLTDIKVVIADAYNGLGGLPAFDIGQDHRDTLLRHLGAAGGEINRVATHLRLLRDFVELTSDEQRQVDDLDAGIEALRPALRALWESTRHARHPTPIEAIRREVGPLRSDATRESPTGAAGVGSPRPFQRAPEGWGAGHVPVWYPRLRQLRTPIRGSGSPPRAPRPGFEPGAYSLGGSRSIQLSYRGTVQAS